MVSLRLFWTSKGSLWSIDSNYVLHNFWEMLSYFHLVTDSSESSFLWDSIWCEIITSKILCFAFLVISFSMLNVISQKRHLVLTLVNEILILKWRIIILYFWKGEIRHFNWMKLLRYCEFKVCKLEIFMKNIFLSI